MSDLNPDDFEKILNNIKNRINGYLDCGEIRAIESNFNTKGMIFSARDNSDREGTIIVGEDKGAIAVDISIPDGAVRSFILENNRDTVTLDNITGWFEHNYRLH